MDDILPQLQPIFRDVLDNPDLVITAESNADNVDGWDSLAHINIVAAIEQQFQIRFALGELEQLGNVGELVTLMSERLNR